MEMKNESVYEEGRRRRRRRGRTEMKNESVYDGEGKNTLIRAVNGSAFRVGGRTVDARAPPLSGRVVNVSRARQSGCRS